MPIGIWARRLKQASFRGVPFFIDSHEFKAGRNAVPHEAPDQNKTFAEDIGLKTRKFSITGHVLGDDYFRLRDNLIDACEQPGPGELVHPYLGVKTVQCVGINFSEDIGEGRIGRFSLEFLDAGAPNFPAGIFDQIAAFFDAANNAVDAVDAAFQSVYDLTNLPGFVIDEVTVLVTNLLDTVEGSIEAITSIPAKKAELNEKLANLRTNTSTLVRNGETLSTETINLIKDLKEVVADVEEDVTDAIDSTSGRDQTLSVFSSLLTFNDDEVSIEANTPSKVAQEVAKSAYQNLVKQAAIVSLSEQSVIKEYKTIQDADEQREFLIDQVESQLDLIDDDDLYQSFFDLKGTIIKTIPNENAVTASEVTIETKVILPALVVVYDLNENLEDEVDFIDRNRVRHPGFLAVGEYTGISG